MNEILEVVDPRLAGELQRALHERRGRVQPLDLAPSTQVVIAGHRAAGKTRLLPLVAKRLGRPDIDLDHALELRHGRRIQTWFKEDERGFRAAERATFQALAPGHVVSVGGGFLSLHADLLQGHHTVLVPISFETYRDRLSADTGRPRLRPELPLEEELRQIFLEREEAHAQVPTLSLVDFLLATERAQ